MSKTFPIIALVCALLIPASALAQATDRVAFGHDVHVAAGEVVHDAISFGGDTVVEGIVEGDAVSFGGSVDVRDGAWVRGEVVAFGGPIHDHGASSSPAAPVAPDAADAPTAPAPAAHHDHDSGPIEWLWNWVGETARSAVMHVLLFLLGLLLIGAGRERLGAMQVTMIKDGLKTAGTGLMAYVAAIGVAILFAITLIGIPAAVVIGLAIPVASYVGLAAAATVLGAALPIPALKDKEIHQLAAGVAILFMASLVPVAGTLATIIAACLGVGALVRTRFGTTPPDDLPNGDGPYRTATA